MERETEKEKKKSGEEVARDVACTPRRRANDYLYTHSPLCVCRFTNEQLTNGSPHSNLFIYSFFLNIGFFFLLPWSFSAALIYNPPQSAREQYVFLFFLL